VSFLIDQRQSGIATDTTPQPAATFRNDFIVAFALNTGFGQNHAWSCQKACL
jgi:hypothetical protein